MRREEKRERRLAEAERIDGKEGTAGEVNRGKKEEGKNTDSKVDTKRKGRWKGSGAYAEIEELQQCC